MGVDILSLMEHNLSEEEIMNLPSWINENLNIQTSHAYWFTEMRKAKWPCKGMSIEKLRNLWLYEEGVIDDNCLVENGRGNYIDCGYVGTAFGSVYIYRYLVEIWIDIGWGDLGRNDNSLFIQTIHRQLSILFKSRYAVYFRDDSGVRESAVRLKCEDMNQVIELFKSTLGTQMQTMTVKEGSDEEEYYIDDLWQ